MCPDLRVHYHFRGSFMHFFRITAETMHDVWINFISGAVNLCTIFILISGDILCW